MRVVTVKVMMAAAVRTAATIIILLAVPVLTTFSTEENKVEFAQLHQSTEWSN